MNNEPSFTERQALGNLIKVLESKNYELKEYYRESFNAWDPIYDSGIGYQYYKTLKDLIKAVNGKIKCRNSVKNFVGFPTFFIC